MKEWRRQTRATKLEAEIARLQRLQALVPTEDDFLKYGLANAEVEAVPVGPRMRGEVLIKARNAINAVMVILRKRDAESPEASITAGELREVIEVFIDDDPIEKVAFYVIHSLDEQEMIAYVHHPQRHVSLVKRDSKPG